MQIVDLLITNAKQLLTIAGENSPRKGKQMSNVGLIENGAVAVKDGLIIGAGTTEDILSKYESDTVVDAEGKVVMPGFVDPHTHPVFVHTRENEFAMRLEGKSYVEISRSGGGIRSTIKTTRDADEETLFQLAKKRIERMISVGTTTLEAKSGYGLTTDSELKQLRVIKRLQDELPVDIVATFMGAHEYPTEYKDNHEEYLQILENEMIPAVASQGVAKYCDIFTELHVYNIVESRRILSCAKKHGLNLKMHADEIEPIGGAELAAELKCTGADHLGAASDEGIEALAEAGVIATLLPGTIFSLGMKNYARARKMIDSGVAVALATDYNPGSCNADSQQFITTLACLQMKMTPEEAIVATTINAAYTIEMGDKVGSLEKGKQADILIMDMPSYGFLPYHFGSNNVERVYKRGILIYKSEQ
ncbi:MAG: imidazolonepropionase [Candidatus Cloacimonetes bacterium]|nr:imidazolonepropionase [Candidatus Cloacimonadota bacterium]